MNSSIRIGNKTISADSPCYIVAEMSGNHNMDYDRAIRIIREAAKAGADAIKIQTYTADTITLNSDAKCFQITQGTLWDGMTLHKLYETAYTPWEWQADLQQCAREEGIDFFSSPFDLSSVDFLEKLDVPCYKIASFEITDIPMIRKIAALHKPIIFATGIAHPEDVKLALDTCREEGNEDIILLKCCSAYPTPYELVNLRTIPALASEYNCLAGLSDHTPGHAVPSAAVTLGACMIEKHMTLRRSDGGPDCAFSMEPEEFAAMVESVRIIEKALGRATLDLSKKQAREREHTRSLFVAADMKAGEIFTPENLRSVRPGFGIHTRYYEEILGKSAATDLKLGTPLRFEMVREMQGRQTTLNDIPAGVFEPAN